MADKDTDNSMLNPGPYSDPAVEASDKLGFLYGSLFLSLCISITLLGIVIYQYAFQTAKPYIVEVDEMGRASYMGEVGELSLGELDKFIPQYLLALTERWRSVTPDNVKKKSEIKSLLCMVDKKGGFYAHLSEYMSDEEKNPFVLGLKVIRSVKTKSVLKAGEKTWGVEWVETTREHDGGVVDEPYRYKANMILGYGGVDVDPDCRNTNPFGIYIKNVSWTRIK